MDNQLNVADIQFPTKNDMDAKADIMIKLLEKLPKVVTNPIVVQHTKTIDEQFKLTVNEQKKEETETATEETQPRSSMMKDSN